MEQPNPRGKELGSIEAGATVEKPWWVREAQEWGWQQALFREATQCPGASPYEV